MDYRILPPDGILETRLTPPPSKSVSNRALILRALTPGGAGKVDNLAECDDTRAVTDALASTAENINIGAAGTAMRFLTAYYAITPGRETLLDGSERMRQRPIAPLVEALRSLGADIAYESEEGFPPLRIKGRNLEGGSIDISADISSQYISALLMIAPKMTNGLRLRLMGEVASQPYINMTIKMMAERGIEVDIDGDTITVPHGDYSPVDCVVEADWSAASYWYELGVVSGGFVTLDGLSLPSLQGDAVAAKLFAEIGIDTEEGEEGGLDLLPRPDPSPRFIADMADCPDLAQTVAVTCALLGIPFRLTGLSSLRIKETDRLEALRVELLKIGTPVDIEGDSVMEWEGRRVPVSELPVFDTYNDHRMAMAFAPVSLYIPGIIIKDAEVVTKSYPEYWDHLRAAGFTLLDANQDPIEQEALQAEE